MMHFIFIGIRASRVAMLIWVMTLFILVQPYHAQAEETARQGFSISVGRGPAPWPDVRAQFPGGVRAQGDLIYAQPLHYRPLRFDLYQPAANGQRHPLLVYVHGGAWMTGTKRHGGPIQDFPSVLAEFAAHGFVVAAIEYRLDGEAKFPGAIEDVKSAIRFLRAHADLYAIDPARVGIFGGSAGGQLAALAGTSCGTSFQSADTPLSDAGVSDCVQAAVAWYGVHQFGATPIPPGQAGPASYLGCATRDCPADKMRFASPATYIDAQDPPMLLIHGLADTLVVAEQSKTFERQLRAAHVPVEAIYIAGVDHGFVGTSDAQTGEANSRALAATLRFFQQKLMGLR